MAQSGNDFSSNRAKSDSKDEIAQLNTPPHSMEAEQAVLGSVIQSVDAWDKIAEVIIQEDFYNRAHRLIFAAITRLIAKNSAADPITLKDELESHNELEDIGGFTYLVNLARNTPSSSNITAYANIVRERAIVRELIGVANDIADASFNPEGRDSKDLLDLAETKVFEIAEKRTAANEGPVSVSTALRKTIKRIEELSGQDKEVTGVSTGFFDLDKKTSGMQPSDLIIVAARPSMGKCIVSGSLLIDPANGAQISIDAMVKHQYGRVTAVDNQFKMVPQTANAFVDDGLKPVFRVKTALGKEIETTITHPFLTGDGWQALENIQEGEKIAVPRVLPIFGQHRISKMEIKQLVIKATENLLLHKPEFFNDKPVLPNLHKLISVLQDYSNTTTRAFSKHFYSPFQLALNNNEIGKTNFNYIGKSNLDRAGSLYSDRPTKGRSSRAAKNLSYHTLINNEDSAFVFPPETFTLCKDQLAYLLSCLFLESGYIQTSSCSDKNYLCIQNINCSLKNAKGFKCLGYQLASIELARQVQHLLLRFGIVAKVNEVAHANDHAKYQVEVVDILNARQFINEIPSDIPIEFTAQIEALTRLILSEPTDLECNDLIPQSVAIYILGLKGKRTWESLFSECSVSRPDNLENFLETGQGPLYRQDLAIFAALFDDEYLFNLANSDLYWDEIVSIEYQGYKQVYDLTVPHLHNFIAQDICVHNTTFAMNLVENALMLEEKPVLVFSLEMPAEQIIMRMLASLSRVDQTSIRTARLEDTDWAKIQSSVKMLNDKDNLFIDDSSGLTPMEVRTRARKLARDRGGISMIMVDYLQLMRVPSLSENRTLEISEISRSLKALAKELECPVIALSQLNRGLEQRADKRPINSDLRESGAIEQDADLIMFIYRDEVYHENSELQGIAEIIIGKQRNGPIGTTRLTFQGRFSRFENYAGPAYDDE